MDYNDSDSSGSDYIVEHHIKPTKKGVPLKNDESADILGNFDDAKRKEIQNTNYTGMEDDDDDNYGAEDNSDNDIDSDHEASDNANNSDKSSIKNTSLSQNQIANLLRGTSKTTRFVLYVTNLNFDTSKDIIIEHFSNVGNVKSVRIPQRRKTGFAFVEMSDSDSFKNAFSLHNTELDGKKIKVQLSEAGKKKSANKRNIMKQKNRKLAEMRNETKQFTKSGKNYDKTIKKEMEKEKLQQQKIWERKKIRKNMKKKALGRNTETAKSA